MKQYDRREPIYIQMRLDHEAQTAIHAYLDEFPDEELSLKAYNWLPTEYKREGYFYYDYGNEDSEVEVIEADLEQLTFEAEIDWSNAYKVRQRLAAENLPGQWAESERVHAEHINYSYWSPWIKKHTPDFGDS